MIIKEKTIKQEIADYLHTLKEDQKMPTLRMLSAKFECSISTASEGRDLYICEQQEVANKTAQAMPNEYLQRVQKQGIQIWTDIIEPMVQKAIFQEKQIELQKTEMAITNAQEAAMLADNAREKLTEALDKNLKLEEVNKEMELKLKTQQGQITELKNNILKLETSLNEAKEQIKQEAVLRAKAETELEVFKSLSQNKSNKTKPNLAQ